MAQALEAMGQEPWCMLPPEIAGLTDWQILKFYLEPAAKRAEEIRRETDAGSPRLPSAGHDQVLDVSDLPDGQPPPKQVVVGMYMKCGVPQSVAESKYEEQMAAWRASKGVK